MSFKDKKEKFYNRFGVIEGCTEEEAKRIFRISIKNILEDIDSKISVEEIKRYCSWFGFETQWQYTPVHQLKFGYNLLNCICNEDNWIRYLHKIESLFLLHTDVSNPRYKKELFIKVKEIFSNSTLSIEIIESKGEYTVLPTGCAFLDEELIIKTLKFLNDQSHAHFIQALKFYSEKNYNSYIKSAESMRRTLEEYLRHIFNNNKGLKGNIRWSRAIADYTPRLSAFHGVQRTLGSTILANNSI